MEIIQVFACDGTPATDSWKVRENMEIHRRSTSVFVEVELVVLPFLRLFYGSTSRYLWEDREGNNHFITQAMGRGTGGPADAVAVRTGDSIGHWLQFIPDCCLGRV